jgi:formate dehydrogenase iron-sulfur subunit
MLIDITKCIGCRQCEGACKLQNKLPDVEESKLSATAYTVVEDHTDRFVRRLCMHCKNPTCESVCPVGAFRRTKIGAVLYDAEKCIGCRYCMMACPFQVPRYEWGSTFPKVQKCILCYERITKGNVPACVEICPETVSMFGEYDKILFQAHKILSENPEKYIQKVYGEEEVGGTSVLYISDVPFEKLGFKTNLEKKPLPELTWSALSKIPSVVTVGGTLLYGIWWITNRRKEVMELEKKLGETKTTPEEENR